MTGPCVSEPDRVLICGLNWLGDSVMSMPAVQAFDASFPNRRITMLVKAPLMSLWRMHASVDDVVCTEDGLRGMWRTVQAVRAGSFSAAYVFPNSWRSALIPFLAGIPVRVGVAGHQRACLLTRVVVPDRAAEHYHQAWEYMRVLGLEAPSLEQPRLTVTPERVVATLAKFRMSADASWIGVLPGAAYGPSKRWPEGSFVDVGRALIQRHGCRVAVFGSAAEHDLCERVSRAMGHRAVNLAGATSLQELVPLLGFCRVAISNDSGGMHLAAAAGVPVVAIFGITDPAKTGPLGERHCIVSLPEVRHTRDIPRASREAEACLRAIEPARVIEAAQARLARAPRDVHREAPDAGAEAGCRV